MSGPFWNVKWLIWDSKIVEFVGWVTPGKIFELMNAATVVVVPSRSRDYLQSLWKRD